VKLLERTLQLSGRTLADVGAGTGLFMEPFAELVGEAGKVFAVDISPAFCVHLAGKAAALPVVEVVQVALAGAGPRHAPPPPSPFPGTRPLRLVLCPA
jgi:ubiquinone/menaquinone biosynthesis C-methylase UbiE